MSKNRFRSFSSNFDLGEAKDVQKEAIDLDDRNEVATEPEVVKEPETVKYKEHVTNSNKVREDWRDGLIKTLSNIREAPSMTANVILVLNPETKIKVSSEPAHKDFLKVKFGNIIGYLKKDLCKME
jgi:hypothetical protein